MNVQKYIISVLQLGAVILLFIAASFLAQAWVNTLPIDTWVRGRVGMIVYTGVAALNALLIAPVSSIPVIPLAVSLWGPVTTAILSGFGWILGAFGAFLIARRWGSTVVARLFPDNPVERFVRTIPERRLFWSIIFLRLVIPVDVLSYVLGAMSIRFTTYAVATAIGVIPFAFIFSYGAVVPFPIQITGILAILTFVIVANYYIYKRVNV